MATLTLENGTKIELGLELGIDGVVAVTARSNKSGGRFYVIEFRPDGTIYRNISTLDDFRLDLAERIVDVTPQEGEG